MEHADDLVVRIIFLEGSPPRMELDPLPPYRGRPYRISSSAISGSNEQRALCYEEAANSSIAMPCKIIR